MRIAYTKLAPEAYTKLIELGHYINTETALEPVLLEMVYLRASLLNGCGFCTGMHTAELHKHHEPQTRIDAVAAWRQSDAFTPRERAALAWTEALTRVCESHPSSNDYAALALQFDEAEMVNLTLAIGTINAWNRLSIGFGKQPPVEVAA